MNGGDLVPFTVLQGRLEAQRTQEHPPEIRELLAVVKKLHRLQPSIVIELAKICHVIIEQLTGARR